MAPIARRHLDAGRGADVEARFVEHHDDVRQPLRRRAGGRRRRRQTIARGAVRFHQAARRKIEQRQRARARELRHVIGRLERLLAIHRHRASDSAVSAARQSTAPSAATRSRTRNGSKPPEQHQQRQHDGGDRGDLRGQAGEDRQQERNGVGVDQHDVDEIRAHDQDVVLEPRQQDQDDDHDQRQRRRDGRPAQQRSQKKFSKPQVSRKASFGSEVVLGAKQHAERRQVQQHQHGRRPNGRLPARAASES